MDKNKILIFKAKPNDWQAIQKLNYEVFLSDSKHDDDLDMDWPFSKAGISYYKKLAMANMEIVLLLIPIINL